MQKGFLMRTPRLLCLLICAATAVPDAQSQSPQFNPSLSAMIQGVDDEAHRADLPLANLKIDVHVVGAIARTTLHATFVSPIDAWLQGTLALSMPDDATLTGYALDIEGRMIDGVLKEPARARAAYEQQLRQQVDPGIAEVSRSNVFSTSVYPISEKGRRIRASFVAPVSPVAGWRLPLATTARVDRMEISIRVEGAKVPPRLTLPSALRADWVNDGSAFVARIVSTRVKLSGELKLDPVVPLAPLLVTAHPSGKRFFQILDTVPSTAAATTTTPARVRIYWDRSVSRRDDALGTEIELLRRYFAATQPATIDLVQFNSTAATLRSFQDPAAAIASLKAVQYRGGTSFATLQGRKLPDASTCLLFSDGVGTIDRRDTFQPDCRVVAVTSAPDADVGYLARLMRRSSGDVLRLTRNSVDGALQSLTSNKAAAMEVRDAASGAVLPHASIRVAGGYIAAIGELPASTRELAVRVGEGKATVDRRYQATGTVRFEGAGSLWAADRVNQLAAAEQWQQLRTISRQFNVASPHMSFIVLENPFQYVRFNITPPSGFPKEWREEYAEAKADAEAEQRERREGRLAEVRERWRRQLEWWNTPFDPAAPKPPERTRSREISSEEFMEVVVTGSRISGGVVELPPWNPDRPYIDALDAASNARIERTLATQEATHGTVPVFYLDVAEWFSRRGDMARAQELVLSALELPASNDETSLVVAARLVRYGQLDRAISLYEQHIRLMPDRPQPIRSLALALAERAKKGTAAAARRDLRRAIELLNQVITTPWENDHDGIEMIALMEVNQLIPRLQEIGVRNTIVDPQLVAKLDVDLRVLIEWNTAATDLDLWVTEPNGETAIYNNPRTAIGGRLSNDMTSGFGPEEYLLRRAPNGRFELAVNVYAADRLNPNGKTTVTARLTHHFGAADEHTEMLDIELGRGGKELVPIGAFVLDAGGMSTTAAPPGKDGQEAGAAENR